MLLFEYPLYYATFAEWEGFLQNLNSHTEITSEKYLPGTKNREIKATEKVCGWQWSQTFLKGSGI